jgi:hypothetical protein
MNRIIKQISILVIILTVLISCSTDYEKTISIDDLTNGSWYLETSELNLKLNNYMESQGMYDDVYRELSFNGDGKSGSIVYFEKINGGESCRSEGSYTASTNSDGILEVTLSGLSNSNGYCSYVNELNGTYTYKFMLMTDIDSRFSSNYAGVKALTLSKGGNNILFQKDKK